MRILLALGLLFLTWPVFAQGPFASFERASDPILNDPHDLTIGPDGRLYVADKFCDRVVVLNAETLEFIEAFGTGDLLGAHDVSFASDGKAYVAVTGTSSIAVYSFPDATPKLDYSLRGFPNTEGVLAHSNGRIYVMASGTGQLIGLDNGEGVVGAQGLFGAHDVVEALDGTIWVADNRRSQLVHLTEDLQLIAVLNDP